MTAPAVERPRILLVDDSMLMRKAASKMLGDEFDVITAADGEEGWERICSDHSIQVVFTDLMMPKLDGYGLLRNVRASEDEGTNNLPVIVVTGAENDESARKKALDQGATDFITKPFSSVDLLARARAHANHRRITRKLEEQTTLDALTGLVNKAGFIDRLQQDIAFARRHRKPLSVVRIEIDDFRNLFLAHGKARAELVIQHVAQRLRDCGRKEDTAARIGLASFAATLPAGEHEGSRGHIERLRQKIQSDPVVADGKTIPVSISAAVDTPELLPGTSPQGVLDLCEALLQEAMREGGNRVLPLPNQPDAAPPPPRVTQEFPSVPGPPPGQTDRTAPSPPVASAREPAKPSPLAAASPYNSLDSVDAALARIDRGEGQSVITQLPNLVKRLMPLFRMLTGQQRAGLISYLQKLGPN